MNGLKIQWGSKTENAVTSTINFSIAFSSASSYCIFPVGLNTSGETTYWNAVLRTSGTSAKITCYTQAGSSYAPGKLWLAIGY